MNAGLLILALVVVALAVGLASGFVKVGRETPRGPVAADSGVARGRLAELVEDHGALVADMKSMRREWADFEKSWERRWGTVTRGMRRDDAAAAAAPAAAADDPSQLSFEVPATVPMQDATRPRLRPVRMGRTG